MLSEVIPKLPMRNKEVTKNFYIDKLGFQLAGSGDFDGYLMIKRDSVELHFFEFKNLNPHENYGQVYIRSKNIDSDFGMISSKVSIHPNGHLSDKPWGMKEFSIIDPDHNLLTFGESIL